MKMVLLCYNPYRYLFDSDVMGKIERSVKDEGL